MDPFLDDSDNVMHVYV